MPTTIPTTTSTTRPGSPSTGDAYFETDTNNYIIYDGANWRGYESDSASATFSSNSYSGEFDNSNDYFDISSTSGFVNSASAFSFTAWAKTSQSNLEPIISGGTSNTNQCTIFFNSGNVLRYICNTGSASTIEYSISTNTWYHVAVTQSGTSAKLYVNGSLEASGTMNAPGSTTGNNLSIGRRPYDSNKFGGFIDEVALFNRELTSTEVSNIYSNKSYNSFSALWRFENNANDESGNYNATNNGVTFSTTDKPY